MRRFRRTLYILEVYTLNTNGKSGFDYVLLSHCLVMYAHSNLETMHVLL